MIKYTELTEEQQRYIDLFRNEKEATQRKILSIFDNFAGEKDSDKRMRTLEKIAKEKFERTSCYDIDNDKDWDNLSDIQINELIEKVDEEELFEYVDNNVHLYQLI